MSAPPLWRVAGARLERDGAPTFLLADTVWAAFSGPTELEWEDYVRRRAAAGFSAVLVSMLPLARDHSRTAPRPLTARARLDPGYLDAAVARLEAAAAHGLTPIVALLWRDHLPDGSDADLALSAIATDRYLDAVLPALDRFAPVYLAAGDTALATPAALGRVEAVLARLRRDVPDRLAAVHTHPSVDPDVAAALDVDVHAFQSGHHGGWDSLPGALARRYRATGRPVLDLEPCYEGHADATGRRHPSAHVRRATWGAVLGGASAGVGYGAHGVWSWHRAGDEFSSVGFSGLPGPAAAALAAPGARHAAVTRRLVEEHGLLGCVAADDLLLAGRAVVGASADGAVTAAYLPDGGAATIATEGRRMRAAAFDARSGRPVAVSVDGPHVAAGRACRIRLEDPAGRDALVVLTAH